MTSHSSPVDSIAKAMEGRCQHSSNGGAEWLKISWLITQAPNF